MDKYKFDGDRFIEAITFDFVASMIEELQEDQEEESEW